MVNKRYEGKCSQNSIVRISQFACSILLFYSFAIARRESDLNLLVHTTWARYSQKSETFDAAPNELQPCPPPISTQENSRFSRKTNEKTIFRGGQGLAGGKVASSV